MVNYPRWAIVVTILISLLGVVYAAPNFLLDGTHKADKASWLPTKAMALGLDLQGGVHLLVDVDVSAAIVELQEANESGVRRALRAADIGYLGLSVQGEAIVFRVRDAAQADAAEAAVRDIDADLTVERPDDVGFRLFLSDEVRGQRVRSIVNQAIEIIRRRVDGLGVAEASIQRQGDSRVVVQAPGYDDPAALKDVLKHTAKMNFKLVDEGASVSDALNGQLPVGSELLYEYDNSDPPQPVAPYVVRRPVEVSGDRLVDAQPAFQDGRPIVTFRFDPAGGRKFGQVTSENVGKRLAIVLDNRVISAPVIRSAIVGGSGIITGNFTVPQADQLALLLRAGALPAPLTFLEERTVGPGLGADSIEAGKLASIVGLVIVVVFMIVAYGLFGIMASVALLFNLALIIATLSLLQATLTLPGIAGIALTIGMAVDANVLIFERIREEVRNGRTPISAIDAGYRRALTTIIDSNLTTLIAALLLFQFGSGPIKGFAVTLTVGIVTSMFAAIMVTRLLVVFWLRRTKPQTVPI
jgi:preprotein translocase subunit SecD